MTDILRELFYMEQERGGLDRKEIPGYPEAQLALDESCQKIRRALGREFLDRHFEAVSAVAELENLACFRHGFRMAGRLVLEAFSTRL